MTQARPLLEPRPEPTPEQRRAADPSRSAWVTASAGTGKTRVLADRVLRLLLAGTDPRQILCLTFTKAAAAEMVKRVQEDLGYFAIVQAAELPAELQKLLGRAPGEDELGRARSLLAEILDLPAGLPIMTIHGFCQSLLKRFPLEAGVVPHFEVIEPRTAADLLREAEEDVLASRRIDLRPALERLAVALGEAGIAEGLAALRENRLRLGALLERCGDVATVVARLAETLDVPEDATPAAMVRAACADPTVDRTGLLATCRALAKGNDTERQRAETIAAWLHDDRDGRCRAYPEYLTAFLTKDERKARQLNTRQLDAFPSAAAALLAEQDRLARWAEREKAAAVAELTAALLRIGAAVIAGYDQRKQRQSGLDYDDLIAKTLHLLQQPGIAPWVQYKLDQQIDHLLVDEGQDTSPEQWAIIEALSAEFFSGEGARPGGRTLFVVGDEKQSIMSVQGADLETFQTTHARLRRRARAAALSWLEVPLRRSFRSAPPILRVVDAVFQRGEARDGVLTGEEPLRHESARARASGVVELWPLVEVEASSAADGWQLPDRPEAIDRAERRLAGAIAEQIFAWLRDGTPLPSGERAIRPGDVMILLPRRGVMQELLVRQLKQLQVPVAGADRLALTDEIAVMDLMALGDALLLPEDDLTLAAVLKSPLFGLDEDDLFDLAFERGETSLYQRLGVFRHDRASFAAAHERFAQLLAQVDYLPPFEFYARLLGEGGAQKRFLARLGPAAIEPIEAFLAQALAYEQGHPPSLQGFLHWLRADTTELIRDPDRPRNEVRVLTVHAAKGLEAPIVFVADATFVPALKDRLLWRESDGLPLWRMSSKRRDAVSEAVHARARMRQLQEQRRLLYVALTRARDHLIVAGWQRRNSSEPTWHDMVRTAMEDLGAERATMTLSPDLRGEGWRLADRPAAGPAQLGLPLGRAAPAEPPSPAWLSQPPPPEPASAAPLNPSRAFADDEPAAFSPLLAAASGRYRRGRVIHCLLQSLAGRPPAQRDAVMARHLAEPSLRLSEAEQADIAAEVQAVLAMPELAPLFGPDSRAEVPLAGVVGGQVVFGQIDRLAVTAREVLVIDYKTNRAAPATPADVPRLYLRQMAAYRALLQAVYPGHDVRPALLWTEGPRLMALDETLLAPHAPGYSQA
jgi:ATP-dependent helicase/nuclease subunit A